MTAIDIAKRIRLILSCSSVASIFLRSYSVFDHEFRSTRFPVMTYVSKIAVLRASQAQFTN